jgi:hypothetical protein
MSRNPKPQKTDFLKNQTVWYLAFFDDSSHSDEKRVCSPSCYVKIMNISNVLVRLGHHVQIVSPSASQARQGHYRSRETIISEGVFLHCSKTRGFNHKLLRGFNYVFTKFRSFIFLLFHMPFHAPLIVYHSNSLIGFSRWVRFFKRPHFILEVEEIYGDVQVEKTARKKREIRFVQQSPQYIFCSDILRKRFDPENKRSAMIYGEYSFHGSEKSFQHKALYAGSLNDVKSGAGLALAAAPYLPADYSLSFLTYGKPQECENFKTIFQNIQQQSKCELSLSTTPLLGNEFIDFLKQFQVGLAVQKDNNLVNSSSFPSKILAYLSCNLHVVTSPIPSVLASPIASELFVCPDEKPETIALKIQEACSAPASDYSALFASLNQSFESELVRLLGIGK